MASDSQSFLQRPGVMPGIQVGLLGMLLFMAFHHILVEPLWADWTAWARGLAIAVVGGAIVGRVYATVRDDMPGFPALRGLVFGVLMSIVILPFLMSGYARVVGTAPAIAIISLGAFLLVTLLMVAYLVTKPDEDWNEAFRERGMRILFAAFLLNAYPAAFLFFLPELVEKADGSALFPFPMAFVLMGIEVICALVLEGLMEGRPGESSPQQPAAG